MKVFVKCKNTCFHVGGKRKHIVVHVTKQGVLELRLLPQINFEEREYGQVQLQHILYPVLWTTGRTVIASLGEGGSINYSPFLWTVLCASGLHQETLTLSHTLQMREADGERERERERFHFLISVTFFQFLSDGLMKFTPLFIATVVSVRLCVCVKGRER